MRYEVFEKLMGDIGYKVRDNGTDIWVHVTDDLVVARVVKDNIGVIDLDWLHYVELPIKTRKFIADRCIDLAFTPPKERESYCIRFQNKCEGLEFEVLPEDVKSHN